jgi:hypothetical protein
MDAPGNPAQNVAKLLNKNANITHRFAQPKHLINKGFENKPFPFWTVVEAIVLSLKKIGQGSHLPWPKCKTY